MALQSTINHPLEFILRLFGIWPSSRYRVLKSIVWTLLLLTFLVFQYWYFISHLKSTDLTDLLDGLSLTLSNNLVLLKLIVIWFHNRTFCDILTSMLEDWNCPSLGEKKQIMIHKANLSSRITNVLFTYYFVSFVLYAGITVALLREDNDGTQTRKFFIKMVFPFDVTTSLLYSLILVLQFVLECILAFAAAMFMALIATLSSNMEQGSVVIMKCFPYYVAVNCEAFILCYTGQYLSEKSDDITEVVYDSLWYELNPREARIILLVIMRSQKQLKLTVAQFTTLSLQAFANMLKASASYVSLLLAVY
ncbi:uncharacterized protein LOC128882397 isoform X5 [Hylaeus volcanicus]|uniref:uncharacterized protein LOC128882397 isoform X5 n=1 Tax=Hylaeus volcanicus TaxID=313075 RepID=UPI0023B82C2E|nr:uncharacterized protein LOC128882397 isoform X5 [Hylaeus volcanicus]